jgi:hypothetical protein
MKKTTSTFWTVTKPEEITTKEACYKIIDTNAAGWTIHDIESISEQLAKIMMLDHMVINDHDVYFINFAGYFGFSCIVFYNGHLIRYAGDYQLHHSNIAGREELKKIYIKNLQNKLYTEEGLTAPLKDYNDYSRREYYIRNYYGDRVDHISQFEIIHDDFERMLYDQETKDLVSNPVCLAYYADAEFVENCVKLYDAIQKTKDNIADNYDYWYDAFKHEFYNYECIYGERYNEAAAAALNGSTPTDTIKAAYKNAKCDYFAECMENGF